MLQVSVVMPTHNRWAQLQRVLEGYREIAFPREAFEVIVCDDASDDDTPEQIRAFIETAPFTLRYLHQEKKGPAAARNMGINAATAPPYFATSPSSYRIKRRSSSAF